MGNEASKGAPGGTIPRKSRPSRTNSKSAATAAASQQQTNTLSSSFDSAAATATQAGTISKSPAAVSPESTASNLLAGVAAGPQTTSSATAAAATKTTVSTIPAIVTAPAPSSKPTLTSDASTSPPSRIGGTADAATSPILRKPYTSLLAASTSSTSPFSSLASSSFSSLPKNFDIDGIIQRLLDTRKLPKIPVTFCLKLPEIKQICALAREVFLEQPMFLELGSPVHIVGDTHGQFVDLLRIFDLCGHPPNTNYLFLGDYVDRGKQSLETILLLLCYKIKYKETFFLLRGNHECTSVNKVYGFYDECKRRCNVKIWKTFTDVFNCLPIAALVAGKIFCVHGGLSPAIKTFDDIRKIVRPIDVPDTGILNDLLWSDPSDDVEEWEDNERGVSYCFGKIVINNFLAKFDLDLICRAHMVVEEGYEFFNDRTLVTVFSAPNYCGEFDNKGAVMTINPHLMCAFEIVQPDLGFKGVLMGLKKGTGAGGSSSPPLSSSPPSELAGSAGNILDD